jgi:hypothetical protein
MGRALTTRTDKKHLRTWRQRGDCDFQQVLQQRQALFGITVKKTKVARPAKTFYALQRITGLYVEFRIMRRISLVGGSNLRDINRSQFMVC